MARHNYQNTKAFQARLWKLKLTTQELWILFIRVQGKTTYAPFYYRMCQNAFKKFMNKIFRFTITLKNGRTNLGRISGGFPDKFLK